ncbi:hypothetical protein Ahy_A06g029188 [Arachis hypogaea]|uniref:Uncharacterized protein n=1 Tax=Arachis hypogaea TaxID=3818 RepID=A0A445CSP2_ARAHY|nr:hypothetical protein Ahy_A06g029188 [Arachis hypogaea]
MRRSEVTSGLKEKYYLWATNVKTYDDTIFIINHQYPLEITRGHFASLKANTYVENLNLTLENHQGKFKPLKTNKPFDIQDYKDFIPYLDKKSWHPIHLLVDMDGDVKKKKFYGYMISRMRRFAGGQPLTGKDDKIEAPYVNIAGQHTYFDCTIYLELIEPQNIKKDKYEWENLTQAKVDHFRFEYASLILFDEINRLRERAI